MPIKIPEKLNAALQKASSQFQELIQPLKELVSKQTNAWLVGGIGAIIVLDVLLILMPLLGSFFTTSTQMAVMRKEISQVKQDKKDESALKQELEKTGSTLAAREGKLATGDISLYLETLSTIASETGVHIETIQPLTPPAGKDDRNDKKEAGEVYVPAYFQITAVSGYHEIGKFVSKIENYGIFIKVNEMSIRGVEDAPRAHLMTMKIEMIRKNEDRKAK